MKSEKLRDRYGVIYFYKNIVVNSANEINKKLFYLVDADKDTYFCGGDSLEFPFPELLINPKKIIGLMHNTKGPAFRGYDDNDYLYFIDGIWYAGKEDWFTALTSEQKYAVIWNI